MNKILITGGSSGIGEAVALQLAVPGNQIYLTGRNEDRLKQVKERVESLGAVCYFHVGDVSNTENAEFAVDDAINKMGKIDVLFANAGVGRFKNIEEFTDEDFDIQFNTNVRGVFVYIRPVIKHMRLNNSGQIIVTSSNLGFTTAARCGIYAATKYALQAIIGALRLELRGTEIKAATINPGSVDTPWFDGKDVDRNKMIDVNEIADAILSIINQGKRSNIDHILIHPVV